MGDRFGCRFLTATTVVAAGVRGGADYEDPCTRRHTVASWLIHDGVPVWEVAQPLGHSSTRMLGVNAHLDPKKHDRVRAAGAKRAANPGARAAHAGNERAPIRWDEGSDLVLSLWAILGSNQ